MTDPPRQGLTVDEGPIDDRPPLAPETLAAQALGEIDAVSGGLAPTINPSTNYEL